MEKTFAKLETNDKPVLKVRKSPVPQSYERIEAGALKLEFEDKVKLAKILKESIKAELEQKEAAFKSASKLVKE